MTSRRRRGGAVGQGAVAGELDRFGNVAERNEPVSFTQQRLLSLIIPCVWRDFPKMIHVRYYDDPRSGQPHIYGHNVAEHEVEAVLDRPMEDRPGERGARIALGQTSAGRYLRVVYVPDPIPNSVFVITAYELGPKAKRALRRRRKRAQ